MYAYACGLTVISITYAHNNTHRPMLKRKHLSPPHRVSPSNIGKIGRHLIICFGLQLARLPSICFQQMSYTYRFSCVISKQDVAAHCVDQWKMVYYITLRIIIAQESILEVYRFCSWQDIRHIDHLKTSI